MDMYANLQAFVGVGKARSFSAAARQLGVSKSVVSERVKQLEQFEQWMAWHEGRLVPSLSELGEGRRKRQVALMIELLSRHLGPGEQRELAAAWESLIHFDLWHRLVHEHKLLRAAVRALLVHLVLAVVGPQRATPSTPRPRKKVMRMASNQ